MPSFAAHHPIASATLTYDAAAEILSGVIGKHRPFFMRAYSGGSRGHDPKTSRKLAKEYLHSQASSLRSHLATTPERTDAHGNYIERGGTLPPGSYNCHYLHHLPGFGECIRIRPTTTNVAIHSPFASHPIPHGRDMHSFLIHGPGPKGSDGCIVPQPNAERHRLNHAIKDFKGRVVLQVIRVSYMLPAERFDGLVG
jgi:hypothetical protein